MKGLWLGSIPSPAKRQGPLCFGGRDRGWRRRLLGRKFVNVLGWRGRGCKLWQNDPERSMSTEGDLRQLDHSPLAYLTRIPSVAGLVGVQPAQAIEHQRHRGYKQRFRDQDGQNVSLSVGFLWYQTQQMHATNTCRPSCP